MNSVARFRIIFFRARYSPDLLSMLGMLKRVGFRNSVFFCRSEPYPCIGVDVNCQTSSGMTPLHNAAIAGYPEIVKLLLKPNHRW